MFISRPIQSYPVSIFIAAAYGDALYSAQNYCDEVGLCVSITKARYVYTGGTEDGVIVGLINYPRFASTPEAIWAHAEALAARLCVEADQQSYTIQAPDKTIFYSHREQDQ